MRQQVRLHGTHLVQFFDGLLNRWVLGLVQNSI
jgi:hypothetical protein